MKVAIIARIQNHEKDKKELTISLQLPNAAPNVRCIRIWEDRVFDCSKVSLDEVLKGIDPFVTWFWSNRWRCGYYEMEVSEEYLLTHENEEVRKFAVWRLKQLETV